MNNFSFRHELTCLLGLDIGCPRPDLIILNSGHHDRYFPTTHFENRLRTLLSYLRDRYGGLDYAHAPRIIWKGNMVGCTSEAIRKLKEVLLILLQVFTFVFNYVLSVCLMEGR